MNGAPGTISGARGALFLGCLLSFLLVGRGETMADKPLVLVQIPAALAAGSNPATILDQRYPTGSRVVLIEPPYASNTVRRLSEGLIAAGDPVVSPSGKGIYFVGKARAGDPWQIYATTPQAGRPKAVTAVFGGAMNPAVISHGDIVFSSPVPKVGDTWKTDKPAALYAQTPGRPPRRLTFGIHSAIEATVLRDGRILFVSAHPRTEGAPFPSLGLYTVNNDGTEVTAFALDHDGASWVDRKSVV
jgi:hypothetical protein